jgi:hypothetical protein
LTVLTRLVDYENPRSLGYRFRAARRRAISDLIDRIAAERGSVRIADLGGRQGYWHIFPDDYLASRRVSVTLINPEAQPSPSSARFALHRGDACSLAEFDDNSFDLVHSNSTIEHVGRWDAVEKFAATVRRLAPRYYVQTPYFWFPIEPHAIAPFYHWLPQGWRAKLNLAMPLGNYPKARDLGEAMRAVQDAVMLDRAQMRYLFPDAAIQFEWFGPLPKSIMAIRN